MGFRDFLDDAVGAQQTELTTDAGGQAARVGAEAGRLEGYSRGRRSRLRNPAVANSPRLMACRSATSAGSPIRRARTRSAAVGHGSRDLIEELMERSRVVHGRERVEVAFVGSLGDRGTAVEIGDPFAQGLPRQFAAPGALDGAAGP